VAANAERRPALSIWTSPSPYAVTTRSPTGTAEVACPGSSARGESLPLAASSQCSRVLPRSWPAWVSTAASPAPQPGLKYASVAPTPSLRTAPLSTSTTAANAPRSKSCARLVNCRGAYTTTTRRPEPVRHALPIHRSVSNPGSNSVAAVRQV
jgi:hypothetical protein